MLRSVWLRVFGGAALGTMLVELLLVKAQGLATVGQEACHIELRQAAKLTARHLVDPVAAAWAWLVRLEVPDPQSIHFALLQGTSLLGCASLWTGTLTSNLTRLSLPLGTGHLIVEARLTSGQPESRRPGQASRSPVPPGVQEARSPAAPESRSPGVQECRSPQGQPTSPAVQDSRRQSSPGVREAGAGTFGQPDDDGEGGCGWNHWPWQNWSSSERQAAWGQHWRGASQAWEPPGCQTPEAQDSSAQLASLDAMFPLWKPSGFQRQTCPSIPSSEPSQGQL